MVQSLARTPAESLKESARRARTPAESLKESARRARTPAESLKVSARRAAEAPTIADVDVIRVVGGASLSGEVQVGGAKNSALKLMAVALLATGRSEISMVPKITDILIMAEVLR